jgi:hypothetical protein
MSKKCCRISSVVGPTGPNAEGIRGLTGPTGPTGGYGFVGPSSRGPTGPKSFIIDHPTNINKYLVHSCLEGCEAGIIYRGSSEITNNNSVVVNLPNYTQNLLTDCSIIISPIYDGKLKMYNFKPITNNSFTVYGENGKFNWLVVGKRHDIIVEPEKEDVNISGSGPYVWS